MSDEAAAQQSAIPVAAPMDTESFAKSGIEAVQSVMRVICADQDSQGTGFVHKSGKIITAQHVIKDCANPALLFSNNVKMTAKVIAQDNDLDLALLEIETPITTPSLKLSNAPQFMFGSQVSTWGFPGGYFGLRPMLSVGVLSGQDAIKLPNGNIVGQWVVNAAFNSGNSGGPLIHIESGEVIGVVVSKLAPISESTLSALKALQSTRSGVTYTATDKSGKQVQVLEGQVIAMVLDDLRKQVQLVIGRAALIGDLRNFLTKNKIDP